MKKLTILLSLLLCATLALGTLTACANQPSNIESTPVVQSNAPADSDKAPVEAAALKPAESYEAVYEALQATRNPVINGGGEMGLTTGALAVTSVEPEPMLAEEAAVDTAGMTSYAPSGSDYSQTNVQVEGVDEGDIIKTDGEYIYILRNTEVVIAKAQGENTEIISTIMVAENDINFYDEETSESESENKYPQEMYISGNRLVVISSYNYWHEYLDTNKVWQYDSEDYMQADVYDISDPYYPTLMNTLGQDGYLLTSRLLDGTLYLLTQYYVYDWDENDPGTYVPCLYREGAETAIAAGDIMILPWSESTAYAVICAYDLQGASLADQLTLLGGGETVYMNGESLYLAETSYDDAVVNEYTESVYNVEVHEERSVTNLTRLSLTGGIEVAATGQVSGYPVNQFAMDEFDGFLRIATTYSGSNYTIYTDPEYSFTNYVYDDYVTTNGLYVLDMDLNQISSVEGLAENEYIYSVRYDGAVGYFCTYRNVDPLFAVDLSDPTNPRVISETKISGFSEYLHVWSEGELFGLGQETDEEEGWTEGLKLVMFDTANKTDVAIANTLTLEGDWSTALYNHKAILISPEKNLIAFPVSDEYYIFSYDSSAGFRSMAVVDFGDEWAYDARGIYIGEYIYVVSSEMIKVLDMNSFEIVQTMEIPWG